MNLKSFLGLVEIRTKLASVIPLALGTFYAVYHFRQFNGMNFAIFFISLLCFDMVTTALNNYFDFRRARKKRGYNYEKHNTIVRDQLHERTVVGVIFLLLSVAVLAGLLLFLKTNILVLGVGMLSFAVGICYSFGPVPISRTPLGELLSGFFMGFVILFLSVYVHVYDRNLVSFAYESQLLSVRMNFPELLWIFMLSIPAMSGIANIMLANNICDIADDLENRRYTLPVYIGRNHALLLFKSLYYIAYVDTAVLVLLQILPPLCLLALLTLLPVHRHIRRFSDMQTKKDTFALSVKNFLILNGSLALLLGISALIGIGIK